jgi:hypothetical protein
MLPPKKLVVVRWSGEFMLSNPETRVSENRTFGERFDITLKRNQENQLEITDILVDDRLGAVAALASTNISWSIEKRKW